MSITAKSQWSPMILVAVMATFSGAAIVGSAPNTSTGMYMGVCILVVGLVATVTSLAEQVRRKPEPPITRASTTPVGPTIDAAAPTIGSDNGALAPPLGEICASFNRRFAKHDVIEDIWPAFDRWIRDTLNQFIGARRVRSFRIVDGSDKLVSLSGLPDDVFWSGKSPHGLIDHVIATGRRYMRGFAGNGELVEQLATHWSAERDVAGSDVILPKLPDVLIPVQDDGHTIGLLVIGEVADDTRADAALMQAVGHLIEMFWRYIHQANELAVSNRTDKASGVLNRQDFTTRAEHALAESINESEPVVVLALSVEGVRRLDDGGEWDLRDWLMRQIGVHMRRKLRTDDLVGRFSDDRFVAVLRRLDVGLGRLIAAKLLDAAREGLAGQPLVHETISLRCGLSEGKSDPFEDVLVRAFAALQNARSNKVDVMLFEPQHLAEKSPVEVTA